MDNLPLEGIRIVDLGQVVAVPFATQWLAIMGAEVILIESRRRTSGTRENPPFAGGEPDLNTSSRFNLISCNKLSCTLDLTTSQGIELVKELAKVSDVMVDNFSTGTMEKLGLGYPVLKELKPDIIVLSVGAFGRAGPLKNYVGFHSAVNLFSGVADTTGYIGGHPRLLGAILPDPLSGAYSALAILEALHHRSKTGEGQYIDMSMAEVMTSLIPEAIADYTMNGREPEKIGNRDRCKSPHGVYRCLGEDKWLAISVSNEDEWQALCHATNHSEWLLDPRFSDEAKRRENQNELDKLIGEWTRTRTPYEAMEILQKAGVPAGPSLNAQELLEDPHLKERGFVVSADHPRAGRKPMCGLPWKISSLREIEYKHAPLMGQHNNYVLYNLLGITEKNVERLVEEEVVY